MMTKESLTKFFGVEFTDAGDNFKASCPFHADRTPSFYVHKEEYVAHCFGCDISGYVDNLAYMFCGGSQTREAIANSLQISLREKIELRVSRNRASVDAPPEAYPESWLAPFKKEVHKYVAARGLNLQTLQDCGSRYDPHKQRQVFPHRDRQGRLAGAVGRTCTDTGSKWLFYWGYDKGRTLYAPFELKPLRPLLLVEGVFDLLWIYQHGFGDRYNLAAPIGATATSDQLREAIGCGEGIILGFDNDEAGQEGCRRVYESVRRDARCSFLSWPDGVKDWMDLDKDGITELLANRLTPLEYALRGETRFSARTIERASRKEKV